MGLRRLVVVLACVLACVQGATNPASADDMADAQAFLTAAPGPAVCGAEDDRVQVMVLAMYHMANPGADVFNLESDDVLAPARQEQIAAVVDGLAAFAPTHVALEASWESEALEQGFAAYLADQAELTRNERQQIGFRLARQAGHERVWGVDAPGEFDLAGVQGVVAADPPQGARLGRMQTFGGAAMALMGGWLAEGTVGEMLQKMNDPHLLVRSHQLYIDILARFVTGDDYAGPDLVGAWYTRNLRIFANIDRISDPGDRVLVVFGQGHVPILRDLVVTAEDMCLVDPVDYLP